jgi:hypothetical protein
MPFVPFHNFFPEIAQRETRSLILDETVCGLPADEYGMVELYCDEKDCDCRRVMFHIIAKQHGPLAVVNYGWEDMDFYRDWLHFDPMMDPRVLKGPNLNLGSPQSRYADSLLAFVDQVLLADPAYIERLKRHYGMVRDVVARKAGCLGRADRADRKHIMAMKMREMKARRSQRRRPA